MIKENTIKKFRHYFQDKGLFCSQEKYLDKKEIYLQNPTVSNRIDMKLAYEYIYSDMKYWLSTGKISLNTFWELVDLLQEDL